MRRILLVTAAVVAMLGVNVVEVGAFHFYRSTDSGCSANDGPTGEAVEPAATVLLGHNTYNDLATAALPITVVNAGDAVRWTWNSAHCHSVTSADFDSGYHYPTTEPTTPPAVPGLFHYPVLETEPTLSYTRTFATPGTYQYSCVHHAVIGMVGIVVVQ
jgi:plastocyanin